MAKQTDYEVVVAHLDADKHADGMRVFAGEDQTVVGLHRWPKVETFSVEEKKYHDKIMVPPREGYTRWLMEAKDDTKGVMGMGFFDVMTVDGELFDVMIADRPRFQDTIWGIVLATNWDEKAPMTNKHYRLWRKDKRIRQRIVDVIVGQFFGYCAESIRMHDAGDAKVRRLEGTKPYQTFGTE